jgi:hypothetical protein
VNGVLIQLQGELVMDGEEHGLARDLSAPPNFYDNSDFLQLLPEFSSTLGHSDLEFPP